MTVERNLSMKFVSFSSFCAYAMCVFFNPLINVWCFGNLERIFVVVVVADNNPHDPCK